MSVRILHTADWQLGRPFRGIPGDAGALLRQARLAVVRRIAELAAEEAVDAVLVAGDVFDDNAVSDDTLRRTMHALEPYAGPWVLLPGNHDAAGAASAWRRLRHLDILPPNAVIADVPEPIHLADDRLAILPAPLLRRHEPDDVTAWFDHAACREGAVRVGLAHGSVENRLPDGASLANLISDERARAAKLDYLALGDWHGTLEIAERTWYAGTPEPDRFRQNDAGNVLLVELPGPGEPPRVEVRRTGAYRWYERTMRLETHEDIDALEGQFGAIDDPAHALLRLRLEGQLDLTGRAALDALLEARRARFHWLDVDDEELLAAPGEDDLAAFATAGFVGESVDTLKKRIEESAGEERDTALLALRVLHREWMLLAGDDGADR